MLKFNRPTYFFLLLVLLAGLVMRTGIAQATPRQTSAPDNGPIVNYARQLLDLIDTHFAYVVWEHSSPLMQSAEPRSLFRGTIKQQRKTLGKIQSRQLAQVKYITLNRGSLPHGHYVNVVFDSQFSRQKKPIKELMTFFLSQDNHWLLAGYVAL